MTTTLNLICLFFCIVSCTVYVYNFRKNEDTKKTKYTYFLVVAALASFLLTLPRYSESTQFIDPILKIVSQLA